MNPLQETLFKEGYKVRIVTYGHRIMSYEHNGRPQIIDIAPDLVGQEGTIKATRIVNGGVDCYAIEGIKEKYAPYFNDQLMIIKRRKESSWRIFKQLLRNIFEIH